MATNTGTLSLTRPREPQKLYAAKFWQYNVGLLLAVTGAMLLMGFFVVSAVVSGWVSDQDPAQLGRILAYDSWLFPFATASVGLIKVGIAIILFGIVRRLWVRVEGLKESLPALIQQGRES